MSDPSLPQTADPTREFNRDQEKLFASHILDFQDAAAEEIGLLKMTTADHEGQLKSVAALIAAVQSSLSAWQNTAIGIAAAIGVAIALLGGFQILSYSEISSLRTDIATRLDTTNNRLNDIEAHQRTLPAEISQQMLNVAASITTIRSGQSPPVPRKNSH